MSYKHMLLIQCGGTMCLDPSRGMPKTLMLYELANSYITTMLDGIEVSAHLPISPTPVIASACPFMPMSEIWQVVTLKLI